MMSRIKATFDRENTWSLAETHCFQMPGVLNKIFHTFKWFNMVQPNRSLQFSFFWGKNSVLVELQVREQVLVRLIRKKPASHNSFTKYDYAACGLGGVRFSPRINLVPGHHAAL